MTTKEQERAALEKIKAILATLDADGWVNTAFAGCVDDAESNICDDFADSWKARARFYEDRCKEISVERDNLRIARDGLKTERDAATAENEGLRARIAHLESDCDGTYEAFTDARERADAAEKEAARLLDENMKLKARLYDLLCK